MQLGLTRYEVTFLVHIGGDAIALNAGDQVHHPLAYPIFAGVKHGTRLTNQERHCDLVPSSPREFTFLVLRWQLKILIAIHLFES